MSKIVTLHNKPYEAPSGPSIASPLALYQMKTWTTFAIKAFGTAWVEQVLLAQLSYVRARKFFESEDKAKQ